MGYELTPEENLDDWDNFFMTTSNPLTLTFSWIMTRKFLDQKTVLCTEAETSETHSVILYVHSEAAVCNPNHQYSVITLHGILTV